MIYVANPVQAEKVANDLEKRIGEEHHYQKQVHINHPNGGEPDAEVYFLEKLSLWLYLKYIRNRNLWLFWCGTYDTDEFANISRLNISVELNLEIEQHSKQSSTRALLDAGYRSYIGHKGMLKGGGSGSVSMDRFKKLIKGISKQPIAWNDTETEDVFVISEINDPEFFQNVRRYVKECERIRELARQNKIEESLSKPYFSPGIYGTSKKSSTKETTMSLKHEYVLEQMGKALEQRNIFAFNSFHKTMQPDMYTHDKRGKIDRLFEIKTDASTQSIYTGIGQLLVYAAEIGTDPQKFLVAPAMPAHHGFRAALRKSDIRLIRYDFKKNGLRFIPSKIVESN